VPLLVCVRASKFSSVCVCVQTDTSEALARAVGDVLARPWLHVSFGETKVYQIHLSVCLCAYAYMNMLMVHVPFLKTEVYRIHLHMSVCMCVCARASIRFSVADHEECRKLLFQMRSAESLFPDYGSVEGIGSRQAT